MSHDGHWLMAIAHPEPMAQVSYKTNWCHARIGMIPLRFSQSHNLLFLIMEVALTGLFSFRLLGSPGSSVG